MKNSLFMRLLWVAAAGSLGTSIAPADETLNEILRQAKWEGIVGTWVDAETGGRNITTTYTWKFKDRVIEANTRMAGREDVSLIGVNSKTGEVFNMSASSDGSASLGSWNFESNGDAVLGLAFTDGNGQEGLLSIRMRLVDQDTLSMTVELPQPIQYKLIRKDKKQQASGTGK